MNEQTLNLLTALAKSLGVTVETVISYYVEWCITASIVYILFGIVLILLSIYFPKFRTEDNDSYTNFKALELSFRGFGIFIGSLFVVINLPYLISPQGIAIHRLISDIGGLN